MKLSTIKPKGHKSLSVHAPPALLLCKEEEILKEGIRIPFQEAHYLDPWPSFQEMRTLTSSGKDGNGTQLCHASEAYIH